jgi:hypothetical protein
VSDEIDINSLLDHSKIVWHDPIEFDMTEGAPPATVVSLDQCDIRVVLHPTIELDATKLNETDRPADHDKKSA